MHPFAEALCVNTAVALVPAGLALAATYWRRPAVAHVLWMLVLIKLATPVVWHVGVLPAERGEAGVTARDNAGIRAAGARARNAGPFVPPPQEASVAGVPAVRQEIVQKVAEPTGSGGAAGGRAWPIRAGAWLVMGWIAGAAGIAGLMIFRVVRFGRILRREGENGLAESVAREVAHMAGRMGISRVPAVRVVGDAMSPMVWFAGRRALLIVPRGMMERMNAVERAGILAHELAHVKRGDHWARLLEMAVTIGLWWHPLMWMARRGMRAAEEEACDAWVVWVTGDGRGYARALVDTLNMVTTSVRQPACVSGLGRLGNMKRRLVMILEGVPKKAPVGGKWAMLAAAVMLLPFVPVRGQRVAPVRPDAVTTPPVATEAIPIQVTGETVTFNVQPQDPKEEAATKDAVKALLRLAAKQDPKEGDLSATALNAVMQFGGRAVPALLESLQDGDENVRVAACSILGNFHSAVAVPGLIELLKDKKTNVRVSAIVALQMIGPPAKGATGALVKLLEDSDLEVRKQAVGALGIINASPQDWVTGVPGAGPWGPPGMAPATVDLTPGQLFIRGNVQPMTGAPTPYPVPDTPAPATAPAALK